MSRALRAAASSAAESLRAPLTVPWIWSSDLSTDFKVRGLSAADAIRTLASSVMVAMCRLRIRFMALFNILLFLGFLNEISWISL